MKNIVFLIFALCFANHLFASSDADSTRKKNPKDTVKKEVDSLTLLHSPKKASIMSALLPGLGQAYNKKYWKIPILYAGAGVLIYSINFANKKYSTYRTAYKLRVNGDTSATNFPQYSEDNLLLLRDYYRRNRDLSVIISAFVYILNIVDASVDAHLFFFDVSDKLSFTIASPGTYAGILPTGFKLQYKF